MSRAITQAEIDAGRVAGMPQPASARLLDWRFESHDVETATLKVSFAAKPEFLNPGGTVQGGILAAMADDVMGPVVVAATGGRLYCVTLDLHATYFRPAIPGGRLYVTASVDKLGADIAFTSALIEDAEGRVIAKAVQTAKLMSPPDGFGDEADADGLGDGG